MKITMSPVRKMAFGAMLIALAVVFTCIAKAVPMNLFPFLRFSPTPALVVFSSLFIGPIYGALVGVLGDLIPAFIFPSGGDYNFYLSFVYALLGTLPWCLEKFTKRFPKLFSSPISLLIEMVVLLAVQIGVYYGTDALSPLGDAFSYLAPIFLIITFLLDVGVIFYLYKRNKNLKKRKITAQKPYETAFICFFCQVVIMDVLKSLAFYAYYSTIATSGNVVLFQTYYLMQLIGSPINFLIMIFLTDLFLSIQENMFSHFHQ